MKHARPETVRHAASEALRLASLEELERRLEAQVAAAACLDDASCLYFLCTVRCSEPKCTGFLEPQG